MQKAANFLLTTACNSNAAGTCKLKDAVFCLVDVVEELQNVVCCSFAYNNTECVVNFCDMCVGMSDGS